LDEARIRDEGHSLAVDPLDWKYRNSDRVERQILAGARPGTIILSHDIHATTVAAMPEVFDSLLAKGYKFVTVSELIAMDKPAPQAARKERLTDDACNAWKFAETANPRFCIQNSELRRISSSSSRRY
jgi:hypothetical protein